MNKYIYLGERIKVVLDFAIGEEIMICQRRAIVIKRDACMVTLLVIY